MKMNSSKEFIFTTLYPIFLLLKYEMFRNLSFTVSTNWYWKSILFLAQINLTKTYESIKFCKILYGIVPIFVTIKLLILSKLAKNITSDPIFRELFVSVKFFKLFWWILFIYTWSPQIHIVSAIWIIEQ
jgi:hypothetical protein